MVSRRTDIVRRTHCSYRTPGLRLPKYPNNLFLAESTSLYILRFLFEENSSYVTSTFLGSGQVKAGVFESLMQAAGHCVEDAGGFRLYECLIDGTFSKAKSGGDGIGCTRVGKGVKSKIDFTVNRAGESNFDATNFTSTIVRDSSAPVPPADCIYILNCDPILVNCLEADAFQKRAPNCPFHAIL